MNTKRKEGIVLAVVAAVGLGGLVLLQMTRDSATTATDERALVQHQSNPMEAANGQPQSTIQDIPFNLLRVNEQPEANRPFLFELGDFSSGALYTLDPGDGSPRKTFEQGKLTHMYTTYGVFQVKIYAQYKGNEVLMLTVPKEVARKVQSKTVNKQTGKPIVDY
jgi:hypothetical protein